MGKHLDELIAGFGRGRGHVGEKNCAAVGCRALALPYALFCDECWRKCQSDLKRLIEKTHRPGKRMSKRCEHFVRLAMDELLYLKTTGHYKPRDGSFEWDDAPPARVEVDEKLPL